jgi:glucosamine--fructose-6-phosphate aminotransferase (isomerizing)
VCGIIGYVGRRPAKDLLLHGLQRLEYRGYDSAGIALSESGGLEYVRAVGNLDFLKEAAGENGSISTHGLGHTRWATHGAVNQRNAHPLTGCDGGRLAIVLNGIVENFRELKESLLAEGHEFSSETDAEVVVHLVERHYNGDLVQAVRDAYRELEGHYAFVVIHHDHPDLLVGARRQCPLVVGVGEGEMFLASSITAFLRDTRRIQLIEDDEVVAITPEGARFFDDDGEVEHKEIEPVDWDDESAEKGGYETFMLKEIYEQPEAVSETIGDRARRGRLVLEGIGLNELEIKNLRRIVIVACGTAYHAGVVGRYIIEEWARIPVEPDIASEWRYRNPVLSKDTLVIGISQSGETADTIAAMQLARKQGARTLAITNQLGTQITREVDAVLYTRAGLEIGVAATKTFTSQVALLSLIALKLAQIKRTVPEDEIEFILEELYDLPLKMVQFLDGDHPIEEIAERHHQKPFFLYLGRHIGLPVALEGALKL